MSREDGKMGPGTILPPTNQDLMDAMKGVHESLAGLTELVAKALDARRDDVEQLRESVSRDMKALRDSDRSQSERLERLEKQLAELATIPSPPPPSESPG